MSVYSEMDRETDNRMIDKLAYTEEGGIKRAEKKRQGGKKERSLIEINGRNKERKTPEETQKQKKL